MKITRAVIMVELENGDVHQVAATEEQMAEALQAVYQDGVLSLRGEPEDIKFGSHQKPKKKIRGYEC